MNQSITCTIQPSRLCYEIEIRNGILNDRESLCPYLAKFGSKHVIITDENIAGLYGNALQKNLALAGLNVVLLSFPAGEKHKNRSTKELLENRMLEMGMGPDTCVLALGGGVVTDLAGYIAATYCRGVPLIMLPTSLLGMVDASIGGKTGVNVPFGKNLLGCIYQPKKVWIDSSTLHSLPSQELRNGLVEMIKHGLIADREYFNYLEAHVKKLLELDTPIVETSISESCRIKKEIVEQNERDGKRHLLNFGHTIGHALEHLTNYTLAHGEAVAIGLLVESHMAVQLGMLKQTSFERIRAILVQFGVPLKLPSSLSAEAICNAMTLDKKSLVGQPRFVMINDIGDPHLSNGKYCMPIEQKIVEKALHWMNHALCGN